VTPRLNHHIVRSRDKRVAADFMVEVMGFDGARAYGPFMEIEVGDGCTLDFMDWDEEGVAAQHYAFLVTEDEFDEIFGRILERGLDHWADPHKERPGDINHNDGGRGVYFESPDGHWLEIITRPYGSGG